ncbi:EGF-like repeat and discoidin I-like domain-containing protein 3 [Diadema setosum]|uniref:EGF-like repeat and discoidin I-like domain-containing protein 3 n=1 Tax=Diadema setosum TaxID=31175 RepID=UPI003B3B7A72
MLPAEAAFDEEYLRASEDHIVKLLSSRPSETILPTQMGMADGSITIDQLSTSSCYQYPDCADRARLDQGADKEEIFQGNTDMNTKVTDMFPKPVYACVVRILPLTWNSHCSMRFDLLGDVGSPVVDAEVRGGRRGAWCAAASDPSPWVQADLGTDYRIEGVITQGRYPYYNQWVTSFGIQYKRDFASNFQDVVGIDDEPKIFQGNTDMNTKVTNYLPASVVARYVRILPKTWHGHCSMRFELLGTALWR